MRFGLWATVLVGALMGTGLTASVEAAVETTKKTVGDKRNGEAAATTGKAVTGVKSGSKSVAGSASAQATRTNVDRTAVASAKASGQKRLAVSQPAPVAGTAKGAKTAPVRSAQGSRSLALPEQGATLRAAQKRSVHRVMASSSEVWHEPGHLAVHSSSALVIPQDGGEPLYEKNANAIMPIASITKVMTAMVVLDSLPNLQATIAITDDDVDYLRGSRSRLHVGSSLSRETALLLALMSSENRAAHALARHYPGGVSAFVAEMNRKASSLGMTRTRFEDPTGLSSNNVSTAHDLARMVAAAHRYPLIREFSTTPGARPEVNGREIGFHNTNQLVSSPTWEIGLSKTGYIQEAGKCLVMQARVAERPVVIVLLDSAGKQTRIGDANRIKRWMESAVFTGQMPTRV